VYGRIEQFDTIMRTGYGVLDGHIGCQIPTNIHASQLSIVRRSLNRNDTASRANFGGQNECHHPLVGAKIEYSGTFTELPGPQESDFPESGPITAIPTLTQWIRYPNKQRLATVHVMHVIGTKEPNAPLHPPGANSPRQASRQNLQDSSLHPTKASLGPSCAQSLFTSPPLVRPPATTPLSALFATASPPLAPIPLT
jgi:hypothetical protein